MVDKKFLTSFLLLLFVTVFSSCSTEDNPTPGAPVDPIAKFLGTWHVVDNAARLNYDVTIDRHIIYPNTKVYLTNFGDLGGRIDGEVVGNTILIHNAVTGTPGYTINDATGTWVNADRLDFTYVLNDGIDTEVRQAVFSK